MLAKVVSDHQTDWDTHLPQVLFAYRTSIHDTTGFTPFHITFGRSPILPIDTIIGTPPLQRKVTHIPSFVNKLHTSLHSAYAAVRAHIAASHQRNKTRYDKHGFFSPYAIGDLVWLHVPAVKPGRTKKFASQWRGPYTVIDKLSDANFRIQLVGSSAKSLVVHHNRMKLCYGIPQQVPFSLPPLATPELQDVQRLSNAHPVGGYTTSSTTPPSRGTRPHRSCGPPSRYQDFINFS